jgi:hypothetical protein
MAGSRAAEVGRAPQIPGPLVRVPVSTEAYVVIENMTDSTLVGHGLSALRQSVLYSVVVRARGRVSIASRPTWRAATTSGRP